jgi:FkbM family methyltransferase
MLSQAKQDLKRLLKHQGWLVERYHPYRDKFRLLARLCDDHHCRTLIDVGANEGQFAQELLEAGYEGSIVSVEPQAAAYQKLVAAAAKHAGWTVAPRMCLGERNGSVEFNIAANSVSSSILPVLEASVAAAAGTRYVATEVVPIRRFEDWVAEEAELIGEQPLALKLDVQGYEHQVLAGAERLLAGVRVLMIEMSLARLYEGTLGFSDLFVRIESSGFSCAGIFPGFPDPKSLRMLQVDVLFERSAAGR